MSSDDADRGRLALEGLARAVDRRSFLRRSAQLIFATGASLAFGSFAGISQVLAAGCSCTFPFGLNCNSLSAIYACQSSGVCSTNCDVCTSSTGCGSCPHATGHWSSCLCGTCGNGCHQCYDCICPASCGCSCACGCRSTTCSCCNCCTPQDIARELASGNLAA